MGSSKTARFPFHSFLVAAAPVLALLAHNAGQARLTEGLRPLGISLLICALLLVLLWRVTGNLLKAGVATTLSLVVLLSYGHLYDGLKDMAPAWAALVRHRYLLPVVGALWLVVLIPVGRVRRAEAVTTFLNGFALVAFAFPAFQILASQAQTLAAGSSAGQAGETCSLSLRAGEPARDVYLIIMDGYERDDVLREMHGYDNTPFLRQLEAMGFYVAYGSLSNYRHTDMSLPSVLNMDYIQSFPDAYDPATQTKNGLVRLLQHSRLRQELECLGYSTVSLETGAYWTEWRDATTFIRRSQGPFGDLRVLGRASRFEALWLDTTIARVALDGLRISRTEALPDALDPLAEHREIVLFALDQLSVIPRLPSPKLVFVHIISPHPPFVLGPAGEFTTVGEFETDAPGRAQDAVLLRAYEDQVTYLNQRLVGAFQAIKEGSAEPPIVIVQGDHGWAERNPEDKLSILNAYLLPDGGADDLYPTITPVNSFRIVLNRYFGADLPLLEDISYFSTDYAPFDFEAVPNTWSP